MKNLLSILSVLLMTACVTAQKGAAPASEAKAEKASAQVQKKAEGQVTCASGKDVRKILHRAPAGGGCEVVYSRAGEENVVAQARNEVSVCEKAATKIQKNLISAGFACSNQ